MHAWPGPIVSVPGGFGPSGAKNVEALIRTLRTSTVCSLSAKAQPESTTIEMPVTGYVPTSASACAYVDTWVPACTWLVSYRPSVAPIRFPEAIHTFCEHPVNDGAGPR